MMNGFFRIFIHSRNQNCEAIANTIHVLLRFFQHPLFPIDNLMTFDFTFEVYGEWNIVLSKEVS